MKLNFLTGFLTLCLGLAACQPEEETRTPREEVTVQTTEHSEKTTSAALVSAQAKDNITENVVKIEDDATTLIDPNDSSSNKLVESIGFAEAQRDTPPLTPKNNETDTYQPFCNSYTDLEIETTPLTNEKTTNRSESEEGISEATFCEKISDRLASVDYQSCRSSKLLPTGCQSVDGVPLMLREFPPIKDKPPLGRVLVIGGTHGDELTSVSVVFRWIAKLNKFHSGLFHWRIMPVMNPDGLLPRSAKRTNFNNVDLNRNMPSDDWEQNALEYWKTKGSEDPRKFPGDQANSEPETRWLVDEIALFKPDAIIAVHAPYGVVDFDARQLDTAPKSLGKLHLNLLGTYPGSLGNYAGINRNIPVVTLELPHAWEMPSMKESDLIWKDIVSWLKKTLTTKTSNADVTAK